MVNKGSQKSIGRGKINYIIAQFYNPVKSTPNSWQTWFTPCDHRGQDRSLRTPCTYPPAYVCPPGCPTRRLKTSARTILLSVAPHLYRQPGFRWPF